ncbi:CAP domain-containing protein [Oscillatoria sp. FACHB-1407]|uniref:CAP domain-containing protein n=1 Tax=Oscillatoria sp. FACHB-1407 TaxID=2692847 RepID=UPI0016839367|nr:CAP domain-containing protein [Oscillatoria sp. FACHB-1407]MBD2462055.1 CAP domain-containing protein [Oscillatoria sp. FACHB-1407]
MVDGAGNRLITARRVELSRRGVAFEDAIGRGDRADFYRFEISRRSAFNLTLRSSAINADVELIQDRNRNNRVDAGDVVASSRALKGKVDSINVIGIPSGTYFVRVFPRGVGKTDYRLSFSARPAATASFAYRVVELTNFFRDRNGLAPLAINTQLSTTAQNFSRQLALGDFLDHNAPDGSTIESRIRASGYQPQWWAENIAAGYATPDQVVQEWINSEGHRRNILSPELREIGVGFFNLSPDPGTQTWQYYWTQSFGTLI